MICNVIVYKFYTTESNMRIKSITRLLNALNIFSELRFEAKNLMKTVLNDIKLIFSFIGCIIFVTINFILTI